MRSIGLTAAGLAALAALGACEISFGNMSDIGNGSANSTAAPAPTVTKFTNSRRNAVSPTLQENYLDFSFDYPSSWMVTPQRSDGTERNFVRVAAPLDRGYEAFAFHVGYAGGSGNTEGDRQAMVEGTPAFAEQFGSSFTDYRVVSVGPERVGRYDSYGWRFTASAPGVNGGPPARVYGRGDFILPPGASRGLTLISLVTDRSTETQSPEQVGESGTLKVLFDSLEIGDAPPSGGK